MNFICGGMKKAAIYKPIKSKIMNEKPFRMFPNVMQMLASVGAKKCLKFMQIISRCCAESFQSKAEFEQYWANVEQMSSRISAEFAQLGILKINLWEHHKAIINGSKGASYGSLGGAPKGNQNARKNNPLSIQNNEYMNKEIKNNEYMNIDREKEEEKDRSLSQRASDFKNSLFSLPGQYDIGVLTEFADYWTQPTTEDQNLMLFEIQKAWDTETRLKNWIKNERNKPQTQKKSIFEEVARLNMEYPSYDRMQATNNKLDAYIKTLSD